MASVKLHFAAALFAGGAILELEEGWLGLRGLLAVGMDTVRVGIEHGGRYFDESSPFQPIAANTDRFAKTVVHRDPILTNFVPGGNQIGNSAGQMYDSKLRQCLKTGNATSAVALKVCNDSAALVLHVNLLNGNID